MFKFQPPIIAHRGASAYAPENTMAALVKAALCGAAWVEFDVMQAASGELVLFHDETLNRTTSGRGKVSRHPYAYLRSLDAGGWFAPSFSGERIPALSQVLDFLMSAQLSANIEIKSDATHHEAIITRLLQTVESVSRALHTHLLFSSFSIPILQCLRHFSPTAPIGLLMDTWLPDWQAVCEHLGCVTLNVSDEILTPERAKKIKNTGLSLLCYTVNDPKRAKELFAWGVDAVFSDRPDMI